MKRSKAYGGFANVLGLSFNKTRGGEEERKEARLIEARAFTVAK